MANKRITDLTELALIAQEDLLLVVDNPAGTPINKKITVANLLGNVSYITSTTTPTGITHRAIITSNAVQLSAGTIAAAEFIANATATATNTTHQYAVTATSRLGDAAANVKTEHATMKLTTDVGVATPSTNTYGLIVQFANTGGSRVANTRAFILMNETSSASANTTKYLIEATNISANLTTGSGNTGFMLINSTSTGATHKLKVNLNGTDFWVVLSSNAT